MNVIYERDNDDDEGVYSDDACGAGTCSSPVTRLHMLRKACLVY